MRDRVLLASILEQLDFMDPNHRCAQCYHSECVGGPYVPGDTGSLICYSFGHDMGKLICEDYRSSTIADIEYNRKQIEDMNVIASEIMKNVNEMYEKEDYESISSYEVGWY